MTSGFLQQKITSALQESLEQTENDGMNWIQKAALDKGKLSESTSFQNVLMLMVSQKIVLMGVKFLGEESDIFFIRRQHSAIDQ